MSYLKVIYMDYASCCDEFGQGVQCLGERDIPAALRAFEAACDGTAEHQLHYYLYRSYFGFSKVLTGCEEGIGLCRQAVSQSPYHADVFLNLARAEWFLRDRSRAVQALQRGLKINAGHVGMRQMFQNIGVRQFQPVKFLARDHILNQLIGKRLRRRMG